MHETVYENKSLSLTHVFECLQKYSELDMRTLILSKMSAAVRCSKSETSLVSMWTAGHSRSDDPKVN